MTSGSLLRILLAVLMVGTASASHAAGPNDFCLKCHGDQAQKETDGKADKKAASLDMARYKASAHGRGRVKCVDCHEDAPLDQDHAPKLKPANCTGCHEDAVKDYEATVHGKARAGGNQIAATCKDCHGPTHDVLASVNPKSLTNVKNIEATCGSCHGNDQVVERGHLPGGNVQAKYHDSIHGHLIHETGGLSAQAPTCTSCHGAHNIQSKAEAGSKVARKAIPTTCGQCHQRELVVFNGGKHGKLQQAGDPTAPVCTDCHSAHGIRRASEPEWQVAVVGDCGGCHDEYVTSFRYTYHGKVTDLGFSDTATCASCHGSHDIRPASDPLSTVSPQNRMQTCRNCHKQASARLASWDPHPRPTDRERSAPLYYVNIAMNVLLAGVFLFFGLHTVLWAGRSAVDALKRRRWGGSNR